MLTINNCSLKFTPTQIELLCLIVNAAQGDWEEHHTIADADTLGGFSAWHVVHWFNVAKAKVDANENGSSRIKKMVASIDRKFAACADAPTPGVAGRVIKSITTTEN